MGSYRGGKSTTEEYRSLDVRWLHRNGMLDSHYAGTVRWSRGGEETGSIKVRCQAGQLVLQYRSSHLGGEWEQLSYPVSIDWTRCNYGGMRPWFICPGRNCARRVAVLYGGRIFACRHCHQLVYESQHEPAWGRALSRAQAIKKKLGADPADDFPDKPKGMHWRTYSRLCQQYEAAQSRSWAPWLLRQVATLA